MAYSTKDTSEGGRRPVGWFSRRHETPEAQRAAREAYFLAHPHKKPHKA